MTTNIAPRNIGNRRDEFKGLILASTSQEFFVVQLVEQPVHLTRLPKTKGDIRSSLTKSVFFIISILDVIVIMIKFHLTLDDDSKGLP